MEKTFFEQTFYSLTLHTHGGATLTFRAPELGSVSLAPGEGERLLEKARAAGVAVRLEKQTEFSLYFLFENP